MKIPYKSLMKEPAAYYPVMPIWNSLPTAEFAEASRTVEVSEPEDSATTSISLVVERTGGATGVVEVFWSITASNGQLTIILLLFVVIFVFVNIC